MAHVLVYTTPARGHLYPLVPIIEALMARGHSVAVRTLSGEIEMLRGRGIQAAPIDSRIEQIAMDDWRARESRAALAAAVSMFASRPPFDADDLARALESEDPDAVLMDINAWGAMAASEGWGGPYTVIAPFPLALRSREAPHPSAPDCLPPAASSGGRG